MNLVEQAESDLSFTLEDIHNGFGIALTLIDDETNRYSVNCQTTDIGFFVDAQTGVGVAGRQVEITIRMRTLNALTSKYPNKNWVAEYIDTNNNAWDIKIMEIRPDRKLGIYNIIMESFKKNVSSN